MNFQDRLRLIFQQQYQIRRVVKEIQTLREVKQKLGMQVRYASTKQVQLAVIVEITKAKLKQIKQLSFLQKLQFKIVLTKDYPAQTPRMYFINQNSLQLGLNPFHDYLTAALPSWNLKTTCLDIIRVVPVFVMGSFGQQKKKRQGVPRVGAYFEAQRLLMYRGCHSFPVKLLRGVDWVNGAISVVNGHEIVLFQMSMQATYSVTDFMAITQAVSLFKHKTRHTRCMLQIRKEKSKYSIQFQSDQYQTISQALVDAIKANQLIDRQSDSSSSQQQIVDFFGQAEKELILTQDNIGDVQGQIVVLQSLVESNPTANNVNQLIQLLKKAVEYYSIKGDMKCTTYLREVQSIMGNQFLQTLINSKQQTKTQSYQKRQYESIANYL